MRMVENGSLTLLKSSFLGVLLMETHDELGRREDYSSSLAGVSLILINNQLITIPRYYDY